MAKLKWNEVTARDVVKAIEFFNEEVLEYPEARSTFLVYNKKITADNVKNIYCLP